MSLHRNADGMWECNGRVHGEELMFTHQSKKAAFDAFCKAAWMVVGDLKCVK